MSLRQKSPLPWNSWTKNELKSRDIINPELFTGNLSGLKTWRVCAAIFTAIILIEALHNSI